MLAQRRFHKETPNVIDAGDDAVPVTPKSKSRSHELKALTASSRNDSLEEASAKDVESGGNRGHYVDGGNRGPHVDDAASLSSSSSTTTSRTSHGQRSLKLSNKGAVVTRGIKLFPTATDSNSPLVTPSSGAADDGKSSLTVTSDGGDCHGLGRSRGRRHQQGCILDVGDEPTVLPPMDEDLTHHRTSIIESPDRAAGGSSKNVGGCNDIDNNGDPTRAVKVVSHQYHDHPSSGKDRTASVSSSNSSLRRKKSIEQARLFAATILNESESRKQEHGRTGTRGYVDGAGIYHSSSFLHTDGTERGGGLLSSWLSRKNNNSDRNYDFDRSVDFFEADEESHDNDPKSSKRRRLQQFAVRACLLVVALAIVVIFSVFAARSGNNASSSINSSTNGFDIAFPADTQSQERFNAVLAFILDANIVSDERTLYDKQSSQYRAAIWMAQDDNEHIPVPALDTNLAEIGKDNPYNFIQRYTLALLWYHWGGADGLWNQLYNFGDGTMHECSWFEVVMDKLSGDPVGVGVDCDEHLQVRYLSLPSNGLSGDFPGEIRLLSNLEVLDLKNNTITGSIPTSLKELKSLTMLDLTSNQIFGSIPHWLGDSLPLMKALGLGQNDLNGTIPASLVHLSHLKSLSLDGNSLSGDVSPIQRLHEMVFLYISDNDLTGDLGEVLLLADMPGLKEADLSGNRFTVNSGIVPRYLFQHERLKVLDLSNNRINASLPMKLTLGTGTPALEFLSFRNNSLTSMMSNPILASLESLKHLDLSENQLTGSLDAMDFSNLQSLEVLLLHDNDLSGSLGSLGSLNQLSTVSFYNNNITGVVGQPFCTDATQAVDVLAVDCGRVDCPCCTQCCGDDAHTCSFDALDYLFERSDYSFNPRITLDRETRSVEGGI